MMNDDKNQMAVYVVMARREDDQHDYVSAIYRTREDANNWTVERNQDPFASCHYWVDAWRVIES